MTTMLGDTGYQWIHTLHTHSVIPHKKKRHAELSEDERKFDHGLSSVRIAVEHVIGRIKRFRIVADRYRNRRKRFALRFKLIAGIYNYELNSVFV